MVVPGVQSDWFGIKVGIPQGSILGPMLFPIYINDIVEDIGSIIRLFADGTSLFLVVDNPIDGANVLNSDLERYIYHTLFWGPRVCIKYCGIVNV